MTHNNMHCEYVILSVGTEINEPLIRGMSHFVPSKSTQRTEGIPMTENVTFPVPVRGPTALVSVPLHRRKGIPHCKNGMEFAPLYQDGMKAKAYHALSYMPHVARTESL